MTIVAPPYPQGYTPSLVFTQPPVERALRACVAELPNVTVALGTEMTQRAQDADGVTLSLRGDDGTTSKVRARWVVGCDGGSSAVRSRVGIGLEDLGFDEPWLVVDHLAGMQLKVLTPPGHRLVLTQGGQCHPCLERRTVAAPGAAR